MVRIIRGLLTLGRFLVGLFGCLLILQAVGGVVRVFIDAPWWIGIYSLFDGLIGYFIAFGAFHHFPWERDPRLSRPAA